MASLVELEVQYQQLVAQRDALGVEYESGNKSVLLQIKELNAQIRAVLIQIDSLKAVTSSGEIVRDDQQATADLSSPQNPNPGVEVLKNGRIQPPPETTTSSNATNRNLIINDFGTDDELRPYIRTQSTPVSTSQYSTVATNNDDAVGPIPTLSKGTGAASDDRGSTSVVSSLNAISTWSEQIDPQPNILDQYSTYTYQASLYLIDKNNSERILNTGSKDLGNAKLLVQSGGGNQSARSEFFNLDYFIDNIELHSFFVGKGTRLAHNVKEIKMTIVEPNGISFVQNLDAAVQQFVGNDPKLKQNITSQLFLLVIKFYGYDDQGNLVRGGNQNNQTGAKLSDPNAFVEKFYPLIISKLDFKIASKGVEYEIRGRAPPYYINIGQGRGTLPFNFELSGKTVKDVLAGPVSYSSTQTAVTAGGNSANQSAAETARLAAAAASKAPATADAITSAKKTVRQGLMAALNQYQQKLKDEGVVEYADEYNIEFVLDSIASASIINPGVNKSSTSMSQPGTPGDQKLGSKQSMDVNTQTKGITAGTQIVQFIDQVMRGSSYVRDQQLKIIDNKTGEETAGPGVNLNNTAWYKIGFKAVPMMDKYDNKRNDYAYKITYTIAPYKIVNLVSPYFKAPVFNGVHKSYQYWFTGKNNEVLSYEESLNSLYFISLTQTNLSGITSSVQGAEAINQQLVNENLKFGPSTASGSNTQGGGNDGRSMEPAANAADQLYSPHDLKECHITIVGDPAWLQQGESFVALNKNDTNYFKAFLPDGTINFDSQDILFEIAFNAPRDYSLATGLIQPTSSKLNSTTELTQVTQTTGPAQMSRIYVAKECISTFSKGKFTQNIKGLLKVYNKPGESGRPQPQNIVSNNKASSVGTKTTAPVFATTLRSSVTNPTPSSALAKGTQQILNPVTNGENLSNDTLRTTPIYIQARKGGANDAAALAAARSASAAGTNNYSGTAIPGIRVPNQLIVKDQ